MTLPKYSRFSGGELVIAEPIPRPVINKLKVSRVKLFELTYGIIPGGIYNIIWWPKVYSGFVEVIIDDPRVTHNRAWYPEECLYEFLK